MHGTLRATMALAALTALVEALPACGDAFESEPGSGGTTAAGGGGGARGGAAGSTQVGGGSGTGTSGGAAGKGGQSNGGSTAGGTPGSGGEGGSSGAFAEAGAGGTPSCELELLADGGFDLADSLWTQSPAPYRPLIVHQSSQALLDEGVSPVSPEYLLWLAGVDSDLSTIYQDFEVPEGALLLVVQGYEHIHTFEDSSQVWDALSIDLTNASDELTPVADFSNIDANEEWVPFTFTVDASVYAGGTATLRLSSTSDDNTLTSFFIDSLSVTAKLCDP